MAEHALPLRALRAPRALVRAAAIPLWEKGFAVLGIFLCLDAGVRTIRILTGTEGPIQSIATGEVDYSQGSALTQVLLFAVYLVSLMLLTISPPRQLTRAFRVKLIWFLPALAMISVLWSGAPTISFRRAVALLGSSIFGFYLGTRFPRLELLRMFLIVSVIATVLTVLTAIALPAYAIDESGAWEGVFGQKNHLGRFMALSAILWVLYALSVRRHRFLACFTVLSVALVLLSKSATSLALLFILVAVLLLVQFLRARSPIVMPVLVLVLAIISYLTVNAVHNPGQVTALLGRDSSLTGRTQLWGLVWQLIQTHPKFGFGYGGFWRGFDGPSGAVWTATGWNPPTAHDGYLDLLLDLGFAGMAIFALTMLVAIRYAFALTRRGRTLDAAFPLIFLVFYLMSNITESYLVAYNTESWVLFFAITVQLHMWWHEEGRTRAVATPRRSRALSHEIPAVVRASAVSAKERIAFQEGPAMPARVTVSAIMPTHNAMPHLKAAIDSVLAQTFADWELIVVDDGSTDGTGALLAQYTDPRIRVFELGETRGMAAARNIACGFASGKYIAITESDAVSLPQRFATEVAYLECHREIHVVASQLSPIGRSGQPAPLSQYPEKPAAIQQRLARGRMAVPFPSAMIRSWCFDRFGPFREDMGRVAELEWCLRIRRNCNFRVLPDALCRYRQDIQRVTFRQWIEQARYERYAVYRASAFATNADRAALRFDRFARRWQTRLMLITWDELRFVNERIRSTINGWK